MTARRPSLIFTLTTMVGFSLACANGGASEDDDGGSIDDDWPADDGGGSSDGSEGSGSGSGSGSGDDGGDDGGDEGGDEGGDDGGDDGGGSGGGGSDCTADLNMVFSDGDSASLDCVDHELGATFEFDPDDAPEVRTIDLNLSSIEGAGFECGLDIMIMGVCGEQYYEIGEGASAAVISYDCEGVSDNNEASFAVESGWIRLTDLSGGDEPGDFTGETVVTEVAGEVSLSGSGVTVTGSFDVQSGVLGQDAEEADCNGQSDEPGGQSQLSATGEAGYWFSSAYEEAGYNDCSLVYVWDYQSEAPEGCPDCDVGGTMNVASATDNCSWTDWAEETLDSGSKIYGMNTSTQTVYWYSEGEWSELSDGWDRTWSSGQLRLEVEDDYGDYQFWETRTFRW